jgi:hypothetical protein
MSLVTLNYASIHWFHRENTRIDSFGDPLADMDYKDDNRSFGKQGGLVSALYDGWQTSAGVVTVMTVDEYAKLHNTTKDAVIERINADRAATIAAWEQGEATKGLALTARQVWLPNGKPCKVTHVGNNAYRRSLAIMGVIHRRNSQPGEPNYTYDVPCSVQSFGSLAEALIEHSKENAKDVGRSRYSALDQLEVAVRLFSYNGKESDLRAIMPVGTAQKVWAIARLNNKYPQLRIVERMTRLPANSPDYLDIGPVDKETLRRMANGFLAGDTGNTQAGAGNADDVASVLEKRAVKPPKAMTAVEIGELVQSSNIPLVKQVGEAILKNNRLFFTTIQQRFQEFAPLYPAIDLHRQDGGSVVPAASQPDDGNAPAVKNSKDAK